jgi:hypothetical protein
MADKEKLEIESTKLRHLSPLALYELLPDDINCLIK